MFYKIEYEGNISDVVEAFDKCQKVTAETANLVLAKAIMKDTKPEELKALIIELVKIAKDCGSLEVIKGIVDGSISEIDKEDDANE